MASQPDRAAATTAPAIASNASSGTGPLGLAVAHSGMLTSAPALSANATNAPVAVRDARATLSASGPERGLKATRGVGTGEKVLVSWFIRAITKDFRIKSTPAAPPDDGHIHVRADGCSGANIPSRRPKGIGHPATST